MDQRRIFWKKRTEATIPGSLSRLFRPLWRSNLKGANLLDDILHLCVKGRNAGLEFPEVWRTILRVHPLVSGPPIKMAEGEHRWLEVPLFDGRRLVLDEPAGYSLKSRLSIALRPKQQDSGVSQR